MSTSSSYRVPDLPVAAPPPAPGRRRPWLPFVTAAAVLLAGGAAAWQLSSNGAPAPAPTVTVSPSSGVGTGSAAPTGSSQAPSSASSPVTSPTTSPSVVPATFRFQPLWPFGSVSAATAWQAASASGSQPWRLDAGQTALSFCSGYLGFTEIDRVLSTELKGDEAWIGVGAPVEEGTPRAVAVLHLARIGTGPTNTRPWEVVGSEDTRLTLTRPAYGATVGRSLTVGGLIMGVDESLRITVRSLEHGVLGSVQGISAGGYNDPWSVNLVIDDSVATRATVVVSTGGHLADVEAFAITAVTVRPAVPSGTTYATAEAAIAPLVTNGTYLGDCDHPTSATSSQAFCSSLKGQQGSHYLYFVGQPRTDVGYFVVLGNKVGRWVVVDDYAPALPTTY